MVFEIWKVAYPISSTTILTISMDSDAGSNYSHSTDFHVNYQYSFVHWKPFPVLWTSPDLPAHLHDTAIQTTSSGAVSKARYTEHFLPVLVTKSSEFRSSKSVKQCYNSLWHPFPCSCRSLLNNIVVTYSVIFKQQWWTRSLMDMDCINVPHCHKMLFQ